MKLILRKIMSDAGVLLADLHQAMRHQLHWDKPQAPVPAGGQSFCASAKEQSRNDDGLCYFHLN